MNGGAFRADDRDREELVDALDNLGEHAKDMGARMRVAYLLHREITAAALNRRDPQLVDGLVEYAHVLYSDWLEFYAGDDRLEGVLERAAEALRPKATP